MTSPHVVVDARMAKASGIGRCIRNLVPRVARLAPDWRWTLLGDREMLAGAEWARGANITVSECSAPIYSVREQLELPRRTPSDATVFWAPHYNAPVFSRVPLVVTIHDVAHLRLPEFTSHPLKRAYARTMMSAVRRTAAAVMCDSRFTLGEMDALFGPSRQGRASVVHMGVDEGWFSGENGTGSPMADPYFLFVGDQRPHKNLGTLLEAFRRVNASSSCRLALVGRTHGFRQRTEGIDALVASLGDRVIVAGELDDAALRRWVRYATALVQPSFYEGFGLPPLEAMAAGCPTIVSTGGSLPEVCGDAPLYFDPHRPEELAERMLRVLREPALRQELAAKGRAHARGFDWNTSAAAVIGVLKSVAA